MASVKIPVENTIIDSHHHLWDLSKLDYSWMPPGDNILRQNYLPEHFAPVIKRNNVAMTVVVQAQQTMEEIDVLLEWVDAAEFIAGVVAWADLTSPDLGRVLDDFSLSPKIVGIRHQVHDEPDETWLLREEVIRGLHELARRNLTYDLLVRPQHLKYIPMLSEKVPGLKMVVDHIAKPNIDEEKIEPWASDIAAVAKIPNIYCKISGMVTEAGTNTWTVAKIQSYVKHIIDHFGYNRIMFGSDWPVCLLAASYDEVLASTVVAAGEMSHEQKARLMAQNAIDFYGLSIGS